MKLGLWYYKVDNVIKDSKDHWVYGENIQGANDADILALKQTHMATNTRNARKAKERKEAAAAAAGKN
jgi:hypothetical protein